MILGAKHICNNCGNVFEHPKVLYGYDPMYPRDSDCPNEYVCPSCESDDYENADECVDCGKVFRTHMLEYGRCKDCLRKAAEEYAADFIMQDRDVRDSFAWWLHIGRK